MARTFFTADHHIGHAGVLSPRMDAPRPFASIAEHDETLVSCWNAVVRPDDIVWNLGDFAHKRKPEHALRVFRRLNGHKFLIQGNHDELAEALPWAGPIRDVARITSRTRARARSLVTAAWSATGTGPRSVGGRAG